MNAEILAEFLDRPIHTEFLNFNFENRLHQGVSETL
jgi:hypothetical protein